MSEVAQKLICLSLNKFWQPVGYKTVKDTIIQLCGTVEGDVGSLALDIDYELDESGNIDFSNATSITPVKWEDWVNLPIRSWDLSIRTCNKEIRVPTVVVSMNYEKMPVRMFKGKPTKEALWKRDGGVCQYTGKKVSKDTANIDHIVPKSRGGSDSWTNMVVASKDINSKKGNRLNSEVGISLIKIPVAPKPMRMCDVINEAKHRDWEHFISKK